MLIVHQTMWPESKGISKTNSEARPPEKGIRKVFSRRTAKLSYLSCVRSGRSTPIVSLWSSTQS